MERQKCFGRRERTRHSVENRRGTVKGDACSQASPTRPRTDISELALSNPTLSRCRTESIGLYAVVGCLGLFGRLHTPVGQVSKLWNPGSYRPRAPWPA